ncbi:hypothetical protein MSAN_00946000 [Mycena sanguinolenta]|uniref:Uncharacterized protein n=1 Tax=Mycena sanguinolenta TaxID=230812 RepID=A0A8H6YTG3_9AGAR|nr:hypothetical protein MSAN_00946000 [Mycena sanguinolenta]
MSCILLASDRVVKRSRTTPSPDLAPIPSEFICHGLRAKAGSMQAGIRALALVLAAGSDVRDVEYSAEGGARRASRRTRTEQETRAYVPYTRDPTQRPPLPVLPIALQSSGPLAFAILAPCLPPPHPAPLPVLTEKHLPAMSSCRLSTPPPLSTLAVHLFSSIGGNFMTLLNYAAHVKELWKDMVALGVRCGTVGCAGLAREVVLGGMGKRACCACAARSICCRPRALDVTSHYLPIPTFLP